MRTLDRNFLATHPLGDEQAVITISVDVPSTANIPANQDGSPASITLTATGETYMDALAALGEVHDIAVNEVVGSLIIFNAERAEEEILESGDPVAINQLAQEIVIPFRTFEIETEVTTESADGQASATTVSLAVTAPSYSMAGSALKSMTRSKVLMQVAVGFCPETAEDDLDGAGEVLVVS